MSGAHRTDSARGADGATDDCGGCSTNDAKHMMEMMKTLQEQVASLTNRVLAPSRPAPGPLGPGVIGTPSRSGPASSSSYPTAAVGKSGATLLPPPGVFGATELLNNHPAPVQRLHAEHFPSPASADVSHLCREILAVESIVGGARIENVAKHLKASEDLARASADIAAKALHALTEGIHCKENELRKPLDQWGCPGATHGKLDKEQKEMLKPASKVLRDVILWRCASITLSLDKKEDLDKAFNDCCQKVCVDAQALRQCGSQLNQARSRVLDKIAERRAAAAAAVGSVLPSLPAPEAHTLPVPRSILRTPVVCTLLAESAVAPLDSMRSASPRTFEGVVSAFPCADSVPTIVSRPTEDASLAPVTVARGHPSVANHAHWFSDASSDFQIELSQKAYSAMPALNWKEADTSSAPKNLFTPSCSMPHLGQDLRDGCPGDMMINAQSQYLRDALSRSLLRELDSPDPLVVKEAAALLGDLQHVRSNGNLGDISSSAAVVDQAKAALLECAIMHAATRPTALVALHALAKLMGPKFLLHADLLSDKLPATLISVLVEVWQSFWSDVNHRHYLESMLDISSSSADTCPGARVFDGIRSFVVCCPQDDQVHVTINCCRSLGALSWMAASVKTAQSWIEWLLRTCSEHFSSSTVVSAAMDAATRLCRDKNMLFGVNLRLPSNSGDEHLRRSSFCDSLAESTAEMLGRCSRSRDDDRERSLCRLLVYLHPLTSVIPMLRQTASPFKVVLEVVLDEIYESLNPFLTEWFTSAVASDSDDPHKAKAAAVASILRHGGIGVDALEELRRSSPNMSDDHSSEFRFILEWCKPRSRKWLVHRFHMIILVLDARVVLPAITGPYMDATKTEVLRAMQEMHELISWDKHLSKKIADVLISVEWPSTACLCSAWVSTIGAACKGLAASLQNDECEDERLRRILTCILDNADWATRKNCWETFLNESLCALREIFTGAKSLRGTKYFEEFGGRIEALSCAVQSRLKDGVQADMHASELQEFCARGKDD